MHIFTFRLDAKEELNQYGLLETSLLQGHCQKAIKKAGLPQDLILITRKGGRQSLIEDLNQQGHQVKKLEVYERQEFYPQTPAPQFDGIFCGSTSAVQSLRNSPWFSSYQETSFFTMGVKTQKEALSLGLRSTMSPDDQIEAVIELLLQTFSHDEKEKKESQEINLKDHYYERKA